MGSFLHGRSTSSYEHIVEMREVGSTAQPRGIMCAPDQVIQSEGSFPQIILTIESHSDEASAATTKRSTPQPPQPQHSTAHDRQRGGASKPTALLKNSTKKQAALFDVLRTCPPVRICLYALGFYEQSLSDPPPTPSPCLALPGVSTNPQHHSKTVGREKVGVQKNCTSLP